MDVLTAIHTRVSPPRVTEPGPTAPQLDQILSAGSRAPDHGRLMPWRFVIIRDGKRSLLAEAMARALQSRHPAAHEPELESERRKAYRAPLIIAVAAHTVREHKVPEIEQLLSVAAAVQNMMLAAHAIGFATMWKTGAAAYAAEVKHALGLQPHDHIVALLYIGTPFAPLRPRPILTSGLVTEL